MASSNKPAPGSVPAIRIEFASQASGELGGTSPQGGCCCCFGAAGTTLNERRRPNTGKTYLREFEKKKSVVTKELV
jgi:hypothetical protein